MMRRSESGWPWSRGVPYTVRAARENITGSAAIGNYVAEVDQKIIGSCTVLRGLWDRESAYVGYLNVEPSYQRQGFGRRLLRAGVDRAIEEGFDRVNLNTWPGNLQALPLYKKMGFFWVPETMVEMVSLIPAVLGHTMFKEFFRKSPDWYAAQVRDLSPKPDLLERDGIRIFQYRFRSGSDEVGAVVDRRGLWLTGGSNRDLEIWIHPENEVSPEGFPQSISWELTNKGESEMQATLLVEPPECVEMLQHPPKAFRIPAGGCVTLEGRFRIDPRSARKESWEGPDRINSLLMIGEETMRFRTGIGRKPALEFSYSPLLFLGHPGAKGRVKVTLRNQTKLGLKGTMTAIPKDPRIDASPRVHRFEIEPEGFAGFECDVKIDPAASTSYLPIAFRPSFAGGEGDEIQGREEFYHASCVAPGGLLAAIDPENKFLDLQNDRLRVSIGVREGGATRIRDRMTGSVIVDGPTWDAVGPPFWPTEFAHRECEYSLERGDRFVTAKIYMRSEVHQGLTVYKEYTLRSGSPLVTIQYGLVNDHPKARSFELQTRLSAYLERATIYLPTKYGLIYEDLENRYPMGSQDAPEKASDYAENWIAFEGEVGRRYTVGAIWPREARELLMGGTSPAFPRLKIRVPANGRSLAPPYHIYADEGSWAGLREVWRKLVQGTAEQEKRCLDVDKRRPLAFGFAHNMVSPSLGSVAGILEVSHLRAKELSGSVAIHPPDGWRARPAVTTFRKLSWRRQHRRRVVFIPPKDIRPGVFEGRLVLETNEMRRDMEFPIVLLGRGRVSIRSIKDQGREAIRVNNGRVEFRICPSFGGTIYSLKRDGTEHLHSSFPSDRPFLWYNPWFGGLSAPPSGDASNGWQESFTSRRVTAGLWQGVETVCWPGEFAKHAKGLVVKSRYLTAGSSNILKVEQEITNVTTGRRHAQSGIRLFAAMGERESMESVVADDHDHAFARRWDGETRYSGCKTGWVGLRNEKLGCGLVFAGPYTGSAYVYITELRDITEVSGGIGIPLEPGESSRWSWYLALCSSGIDEINRHRLLRDLVPSKQSLGSSRVHEAGGLR